MVHTTSYVFHLANRNVRVVSLNFMAKDLHHMAGFQYLTDINIPRDKKKTISWMLKDKIVNGIRKTIFQHPKYTLEQKLENEPNAVSTSNISDGSG